MVEKTTVSSDGNSWVDSTPIGANVSSSYQAQNTSAEAQRMGADTCSVSINNTLRKATIHAGGTIDENGILWTVKTDIVLDFPPGFGVRYLVLYSVSPTVKSIKLYAVSTDEVRYDNDRNGWYLFGTETQRVLNSAVIVSEEGYGSVYQLNRSDSVSMHDRRYGIPEEYVRYKDSFMVGWRKATGVYDSPVFANHYNPSGIDIDYTGGNGYIYYVLSESYKVIKTNLISGLADTQSAIFGNERSFRGVCMHGGNMFLSDDAGKKIVKCQGFSTTILQDVSVVGNINAIASDGVYIWTSDASADKVYKRDAVSLNVLATYDIPKVSDIAFYNYDTMITVGSDTGSITANNEFRVFSVHGNDIVQIDVFTDFPYDCSSVSTFSDSPALIDKRNLVSFNGTSVSELVVR